MNRQAAYIGLIFGYEICEVLTSFPILDNEILGENGQIMQTLIMRIVNFHQAIGTSGRSGVMFDQSFEELQQKLKEIMEEATSLAAGVKAWMLLSKEGLPIASGLPQGMEEAEVAAMTASIVGVADLAAERMEQGLLEEVLLTNEQGLLIMKSSGEKAILVLSARKDMKTGLLVYAAKQACEKIAPLL